jgi:hypothetical protein
MPYEIFSQKATRLTVPALSVNPDGRLSLNSSAAQIFHNHGVEAVLLMWDKEARKIALRPTSNKKETRAYKVSFGKRINAGNISAKSFTDYIGWNHGAQRRTLAAHWNGPEGIMEIVVPAEYLTSVHAPAPKLAAVEKRKSKAAG